MMDLLNEVMGLVEKMPELATWVLAGLLFYKVVYIGSTFGILRLAINSGFKYLSDRAKEPTVLIKPYLGSSRSMFDRSHSELQNAIEVAVSKIPFNSEVRLYLDPSEVSNLARYIKAYSPDKKCE